MNLVDRAIAPGATRQEVLAGFGAALAGVGLALPLALDAHLPALSVAVVAVVAFDLSGGAVVNATDAAKRWYHRPGRTARHHLTFVALHITLPPELGWFAPLLLVKLLLAHLLPDVAYR